MRLAYLCNLYPAVSHSFVRREIEGVELAGHSVERYSLRPAPADLHDPADIAEVDRTTAVLGRGIARLIFAALTLSLTHPAKTLSALSTAYRLSSPGLKSKLRHVAYWLEAAWLRRRLRDQHVQHLHAHFGTNPAAVAAITNAWGGPPFSFTVHGPDEFDAPLELSLPQKLKASTFAVAISDYGRGQLMRWTDLDVWKKIEVVRCGVDSAYLDSPSAAAPDTSEFVCVARLAAQKGLPLLIAACELLRDAGEKFKVTIIGEGQLRSALEGDIRSKGLEKEVQLVGAKSAASIRGHLLRARAFVLPSFAEGLPVVLMEALALQRPVITTAIAGVPELVDHECGWLIISGSEQALADAMAQALRAPLEELRSKGTKGRERVVRLHDSRRNGSELADIIERRSSFSDSSARSAHT